MSRPPRGTKLASDLDRWRSVTPPSVLLDISPSRGEIGCFPAILVIGESPDERAISPIEGEMSGRTEGGALAPKFGNDGKSQSIRPPTTAEAGNNPAIAS